MAGLRRLGVWGETLPTKKTQNVEPADFQVAGLIGKFERKFDKPFVARSPEEAEAIFGGDVIETYYGPGAVKDFFNNAVGTSGKIFIYSYVGNDGSVIDATQATKNYQDGDSADVLSVSAAFQEEPEYGVSGNRTGITIENGNRFVTSVASAGATSDIVLSIDSVADIKVGDAVKITGDTSDIYRKISAVDEGTKTVTLDSSLGESVSEDADFVVPGFKLRVWRKNLGGLVEEKDVELGKEWLSLESEVSDYFVENVFQTSHWISVSVLSPGTSLGANYFPATVSTTTYLETGSDGTSPTSANQWWLSRFDALPIRMVANPETTDQVIQKAGETYCKGRNDTPKWIYNLPEDQTEEQLKTLGSNLQRSDDVLGVAVANWLTKADPFSDSISSPDRNVPNVGAVMGAWIRSINNNGIHYIPAVSNIPLFGFTGVVGEQFKNDNIRTELANYGVNVVQNKPGSGILIKNFFTPSTTKEFRWANGLLMREFIRVSIVNSLTKAENKPNVFSRIKNNKSAARRFLYRLWTSGSTGNVPTGETFGQTIDPGSGQGTTFESHVIVQADIVNNPQSGIESGERNIDIWFTYPTPAGSIKIGTGLMLLG